MLVPKRDQMKLTKTLKGDESTTHFNRPSKVDTKGKWTKVGLDNLSFRPWTDIVTISASYLANFLASTKKLGLFKSPMNALINLVFDSHFNCIIGSIFSCLYNCYLKSVKTSFEVESAGEASGSWVQCWQLISLNLEIHCRAANSWSRETQCDLVLTNWCFSLHSLFFPIHGYRTWRN